MMEYARRNTKSGMTLLRLVAALVIISTFIGVMALFIHKITIYSRDMDFQLDLKILRLCLELYKKIERKYPEDLKTLFKARYKAGTEDEVSFSEKFLGTVNVDAEGYPIDPSGNRYRYDPGRGVVGSTTEGYENW